jgi:hypothetical protein
LPNNAWAAFLVTLSSQVIVVYDSATGEKNVIRQPRNSQSLEFETVEVISRDSVSPPVRCLTEMHYSHCLNED